MPVAWIVLVAVLWALVIVLTLLVLGLNRRFTAAMQILEARQDQPAALGNGIAFTGPEVGTTVDRFDRERRREADDPARELDQLVLVMSASCGPCHALASALESARRGGLTFADQELVLVTDPAGEDAYAGLEPDQVVIQHANEIAQRLSINATPYGFALDDVGIVRWAGPLSGVDDIRAMAAACAPSEMPEIAQVS